MDVKQYEPKIEEIINLVKNPFEEDLRPIFKAFEFSKKAHEGQKRFSGEPYFIHPFETAKIVAGLRLDVPTIAASLLHDTCEDCLITGGKTNIDVRLLKKEFGEEIAFLVEGVTKLGKLKYRGEERMVENLRKMFMAMAKDIRVVLIKLADRLHNMHTLQYISPEKQKRIAMETMEIYAPLANRLGMGEFKGRLEDLAFTFIYPDDLEKIKELIKDRYKKREDDLEKIKIKIEREIKIERLKDIKIDSRVKHLYSLFKKLQRPEVNMDINKVYDFIALRIVTNSVEECYKVLGIIHKLWKPLPGRIKDYIALPKPNGYQSLHTTVFAERGKITEIQIRTEKMHEEAEYGIAAHWVYEETGKPKTGARIQHGHSWVQQLVEWQKDVSKSKDFLETLRIDFFNNRVFCLTPKGDVIDLPEGATAIDFAYAVHSEIGNCATGAVINDKFVSLNSVLKNGDIIKIQVQKNKKPSTEWLEHTKTSFAKKEIKSELKKGEKFRIFKIF